MATPSSASPAKAELLAAALAYAARGWHVIPLYALRHGCCTCQARQHCKSPGKHPMPEAWPDAASCATEKITAWWRRHPAANIGIVTGAVSRLVVLDVDPRHGGDVNLEELQQIYARLPETPMVLSGGGGQHYYFACTDTLPSCDLASGLNFQTEAHQVVAPPSLHTSGRRYLWELSHEPDDIPLAPLPDWIRALAETHAHAQAALVVTTLGDLPPVMLEDLRVSARVKAILQTGQDPDNPTRYPSRSEAVYDMACALLYAGYDDATTAAVLLNPAWRISDKPRSVRDPRSPHYEMHVRNWIAKEIARARAKQGYAQNGAAPLTDPLTSSQAGQDLDSPMTPSLGWNDYVNALHFVRDHGHNLRYCHPWKTWLVWNGRCWERDTTGAVMQMAKESIKRLARQVETLEDDKAKALMTHIKKSLSTPGLEAMIKSARSEPGIPAAPDAFDTNIWLLNCQNGTLDLTTGRLRPHDRSDLLTKCLPTAYDPQAACSAWKAFLWRVMGQRQEMIDFLQRAVGYSLTGSTREQCLFLLWGITKTGKSTFLATLRALLGPYGHQADMQSFMHKERDEVRNDLAALAGSRLVCALESSHGRQLNEALVKQLTGGTDRITARFLFQELFEFTPQFKIFLGTNHKPVIKDADDAIWERIKPVPFTVQIPQAERNKRLDLDLQAELPGILAWAVRGCLAWQQLDDLDTPQLIVDSTQDYRAEMDTLAHFLDECCLAGPPTLAKVKAPTLASAYHGWCKRAGVWPMDNSSFIAELLKRGYERKRGTANQYYWHGLGLANAGDERYETL